jgi:MFS family permease
MPILLSYGSGKLSDLKGRQAILLVSFLISFLGLISLYFSSQGLLLILGVLLIAIYYSIVSPITLALVGDVTTQKNLEYLTSFFWMAQNGGVLLSLILSAFIQTKIVYLISIGVLFFEKGVARANAFPGLSYSAIGGRFEQTTFRSI